MGLKSRLTLLCMGLALFGVFRAVSADAVSTTAGCTAGCGTDGSPCTCPHCGGACCRLVPGTKTVKKTVYSCKLVPYCKTKCPNPLRCRHDESETCPTCEERVRYRRVLLKREITTKVPECKCVPWEAGAISLSHGSPGESAPPPTVPPAIAAPWHDKLYD